VAAVAVCRHRCVHFICYRVSHVLWCESEIAAEITTGNGGQRSQKTRVTELTDRRRAEVVERRSKLKLQAPDKDDFAAAFRRIENGRG